MPNSHRRQDKEPVDNKLNLQQLPSKETTMRLMFVASKGYCIVGGDYSQQEPRLLSHITQDKNLIDTYNKNRDLYATIGSFMFKKDYWECMEHWEDGSPNPDGKVIRSKCKQIILGKYNCPIKTA